MSRRPGFITNISADNASPQTASKTGCGDALLYLEYQENTMKIYHFTPNRSLS